MLIPSQRVIECIRRSSLSRRVNANSQRASGGDVDAVKLIKKGEC